MAFIEVINGNTVINTDSGCDATGQNHGYVQIRKTSDLSTVIQQYSVPCTVPYSKILTGLIAGTSYRVSLYAWSGSVIGYFDFTYVSPPGTGGSSSSIVVAIIILIALYFMWKG